MSDPTSLKTTAAETIPSVDGGLSALASANAPFIYFDGVSNAGLKDGVVHMTLETVRHLSTDSNHVANDRVIVAHLRMSVVAFQTLKAAIAGVELLAQPQSEIAAELKAGGGWEASPKARHAV